MMMSSSIMSYFLLRWKSSLHWNFMTPRWMSFYSLLFKVLLCICSSYVNQFTLLQCIRYPRTLDRVSLKILTPTSYILRLVSEITNRKENWGFWIDFDILKVTANFHIVSGLELRRFWRHSEWQVAIDHRTWNREFHKDERVEFKQTCVQSSLAEILPSKILTQTLPTILFCIVKCRYLKDLPIVILSSL